MSSIFVKEKTNNIIIEEDGYSYEYISDLKITRIINFFENNKRILIIVEEENMRLYPAIVFNKKTKFFKIIKYLPIEILEQKDYKDFFLNKNKKILNENKITAFLTQHIFFYKIHYYKNKNNIFYIEIYKKDEKIKEIKTKVILPEKIELFNSISIECTYSGYGDYYILLLRAEKYANILIYNTKQNIGFRKINIISKKSNGEIIDFVFENFLSKKKEFLKNKMIFEVIKNDRGR